MKKKTLSFIILILFAFLPKLPYFDSNLIKFYLSRDKELNNDIFTRLKTAQENVVWSRTWDNLYDIGYGIWGDETYIYTCGSTETAVEPNDRDLLLIKWDIDGNQLWNRTWGGSSLESGLAICGNGAYIYTCGVTSSYAIGAYDMLLIKWDSSGNQLWNRTWGDVGNDYARAIWGDGINIYICGDSEYSGENGTNSDLTVLKWDSEGNKIWNTTWGGYNNEQGSFIWGDELHLYVGGFTQSYGEGGTDALILRLKGGIMEGFPTVDWWTPWGSSGDHDEMFYDIWSDGTYLYTSGVTDGMGMGGFDVLLVKWQIDGKLLWDRTWGGSGRDEGIGIWGPKNKKFVYTCGYSNSDAGGCIVKWDDNGNQAWNRIWGEMNVDYPNAIWGDGMNIYTTGVDSSEGDADLALVHWYFDEGIGINLVDPGPLENLVFESGTQINIDIHTNLVILNEVLYKWDGALYTVWGEPYITKLPAGDGSHSLYVSVKTTTPYYSDSQSFIFTTDDTDPDVQILNPITNDICVHAPLYDLDITEPHLDQMWYTLNDGPNHFITTSSGEISESAWNSVPDGKVKIKFYVSDILGHIGSDDVIVQKNSKAGESEILGIIINAIIYGAITGVVGIMFFFIKRKLGKKKHKVVPENDT